MARINGRKPSSGALLASSSFMSLTESMEEEIDDLAEASPADLLARCRTLADGVQVPATVRKDLTAAMEAAGACLLVNG